MADYDSTSQSEYDEQLQCLVENNAQPNLVLLNNLLPLCSLDARKKANNELTKVEINNFVTAAVISHTYGLVDVLAPFLAEDFNLLCMAILLKNTKSAHALIGVFGFHAEAFELSSQMGLESVVEHLLPLSEPKDKNSEALYQAVRCNHQNCVDLLYAVSDPNVVVERLKQDFPHHTTPVWDDFKARVERDVLRETVGNAGVTRTSKM